MWIKQSPADTESQKGKILSSTLHRAHLRDKAVTKQNLKAGGEKSFKAPAFAFVFCFSFLRNLNFKKCEFLKY